METKNACGSNAFGSEFGDLPHGGFKDEPFKGAARIGNLNHGDTVLDKDGKEYKISIAKSSEDEVVIGISSPATGNYDTLWMISEKSNYIAFKKV